MKSLANKLIQYKTNKIFDHFFLHTNALYDDL